jgi:hypothetical protein
LNNFAYYRGANVAPFFIVQYTIEYRVITYFFGGKSMKKNKNKIKRKLIVLVVVLISIIFLFPIFMDKYIIGNQIKSNISNENWVSFLGSYVGSIVSGFFTFLVLYITIQHEKKKSENARAEIEQQRLEDKRLSILPFLSYKIIDDLKVKEIENKLHSDPYYHSKDYEIKAGIVNTDIDFNVCLENLGLGIALEPRLVRVDFGGLKNMSLAENILVLNINEKAFLRFGVVLPKGEVDIMKLKIGYYNIFRDYYEQDLSIEFEPVIQLIQGYNNNIVGQGIKYESVRIIDISKAIIKENPDIKRMTLETSLGSNEKI